MMEAHIANEYNAILIQGFLAGDLDDTRVSSSTSPKRIAPLRNLEVSLSIVRAISRTAVRSRYEVHRRAESSIRDDDGFSSQSYLRRDYWPAVPQTAAGLSQHALAAVCGLVGRGYPRLAREPRLSQG